MPGRFALYAVGPLVFVAIMLALWLNLRLQLLQKDIEELGLRREAMVVAIAERSRTLSMRSGFAEVAPHSRERGLQPALHDQVVALALAPETETTAETFAEKVNGAFTRFSAARARSTTTNRPREGVGM